MNLVNCFNLEVSKHWESCLLEHFVEGLLLILLSLPGQGQYHVGEVGVFSKFMFSSSIIKWHTLWCVLSWYPAVFVTLVPEVNHLKIIVFLFTLFGKSLTTKYLHEQFSELSNPTTVQEPRGLRAWHCFRFFCAKCGLSF